MNLIFFLNCLSPHLMPFISELHKLDKIKNVLVIVPFINYQERQNMGWDGDKWSQNNNIKILTNPNEIEVKNILNIFSHQKSWFIFSGINAFPIISGWFKLSLKFDIHRAIITEPPYIYRYPLCLHALRFAIKDWKYVKFIDKVFLMGDKYINYYKMWSKKWEIIPFIYCTEWKDRNTSFRIINKDKLNLIYVGSLSHRKNVKLLINAIKTINSNEIHLGIIGNGEEYSMLKKLSKDSDIYFYGTKSMNDISNYLEQYDVLVLPSLHDGWGAVVNEALTLGLYIICSDNCGSTYLLKDSYLGISFKSNNVKSLQNCILETIKEKNEIRNSIEKRISWSKRNIHGKVVANYFVSQLLSNN